MCGSSSCETLISDSYLVITFFLTVYKVQDGNSHVRINCNLYSVGGRFGVINRSVLISDGGHTCGIMTFGDHCIGTDTHIIKFSWEGYWENAGNVLTLVSKVVIDQLYKLKSNKHQVLCIHSSVKPPIDILNSCC